MPGLALPLVTVVTPSFNYGRFIKQCLESVRSQTYPAIEHIVMDACSTDETADVIARGARYNLRAFFEKDDGQADAINRGFARANGEILCWLNADDFYLHERVVEEAVAALARADLVSAGGWTVDGNGVRLRRIRAHPARSIHEIRHHDTLLQPATFWRRAVHRSLRSDLHYVMDWQLWLEIRAAGARFEVLDREWAAYRWHAINKTAADPAARRGEVAGILLAQFGATSPQYRWANAMHRGYLLAEARRRPALKRALYLANVGLYHVTRRRVFSC